MMGCIQVAGKRRVLVFEQCRSKEQKISPLSSCKTGKPSLPRVKQETALIIRKQISLRQTSGFAQTLKGARQRRRVSCRNIQHRKGNAQNQHRAHERGNRSVRKSHDSSPQSDRKYGPRHHRCYFKTASQMADQAKNLGWGNASVVMSVPSLSYVICCLFNLNVVSSFGVAFHD
jgi:hypothetical protein